jgi:hypothetical protein
MHRTQSEKKEKHFQRDKQISSAFLCPLSRTKTVKTVPTPLSQEVRATVAAKPAATAPAATRTTPATATNCSLSKSLTMQRDAAKRRLSL